jgi:hypothetical protein
MLNSDVVELADDATAHDEVTDDEVTDDEVTDDEVTDDEVTDDEVTDDALTDDALTDDAVMAVLFSFLMHLMGLDSISHTIAMLLVGSTVFEAISFVFVFVTFCAHFCS